MKYIATESDKWFVDGVVKPFKKGDIIECEPSKISHLVDAKLFMEYREVPIKDELQEKSFPKEEMETKVVFAEENKIVDSEENKECDVKEKYCDDYQNIDKSSKDCKAEEEEKECQQVTEVKDIDIYSLSKKELIQFADKNKITLNPKSSKKQIQKEISKELYGE